MPNKIFIFFVSLIAVAFLAVIIYFIPTVFYQYDGTVRKALDPLKIECTEEFSTISIRNIGNDPIFCETPGQKCDLTLSPSYSFHISKDQIIPSDTAIIQIPNCNSKNNCDVDFSVVIDNTRTTHVGILC